MQQINEREYTLSERERHDAAYGRPLAIIESPAPAAGGFLSLLGKELAAGLHVNYKTPGFGDWTLLHYAVFYSTAARAGLPQVLIEAGADVNAQDDDDRTPLGYACWHYVHDGAPEYLALINILLKEGARRRSAKMRRRASTTRCRKR